MKAFLFALSFSLFAFSSNAQKYLTRSGKITFFSSTPIENIEAFNNEVAAAYNSTTGDVLFQVPIKSFKFEKQLMQEHFNEDYMESDKYPKAVFKGKLNAKDIGEKDGAYTTSVSGALNIHGVTKEVSIPGSIVKKGDELTFNAKFTVLTADYKISIPSIAKGKVADKIEVSLNSILKKQ